MKKLYRVEVSFNILVYAEDENEAEKVAKQNSAEEFRNDCGVDYFVNEVKKNAMFDSETLLSLVWGAEEDKTVAQCMAEIKPTEDPSST